MGWWPSKPASAQRRRSSSCALPGTKGTLLVAMTGWAQEEDRRRCYEAGFDGHLPKPVEWDALRQFLAHPKLQKPAAQG